MSNRSSVALPGRGDVLPALRTVLVESTELAAWVARFDLNVTSITTQTGDHQIQFGSPRTGIRRLTCPCCRREDRPVWGPGIERLGQLSLVPGPITRVQGRSRFPRSRPKRPSMTWRHSGSTPFLRLRWSGRPGPFPETIRWFASPEARSASHPGLSSSRCRVAFDRGPRPRGRASTSSRNDTTCDAVGSIRGEPQITPASGINARSGPRVSRSAGPERFLACSTSDQGLPGFRPDASVARWHESGRAER